ncbi:hypothetical protein BD311DRAFT_757793 [Dichomitus squalens]|uniref:Uncharacterized protein n=1 Tax=Dichomitus squalens TaxID=114155 RepID=A0A4Q9MM13_9APHY|nr:hypothetical protein BD311DRAFT_757793 [Dichomitus squalens]
MRGEETRGRIVRVKSSSTRRSRPVVWVAFLASAVAPSPPLAPASSGPRVAASTRRSRTSSSTHAAPSLTARSSTTRLRARHASDSSPTSRATIM